nr:UDP-N-acetylglucosamine 2-epimerase (non-hydrolyzing) [Rhodovibrio salinarum]
MTIVGTRPEIIRLSRVIARLEAAVDHVLVHTGQNYDRELNEIFFEDLAINPPKHIMGISPDSLGAALGDVMRHTERILLAEQPDALLILGDTNSALSAIVAKRMRVPVYHMEAGNRCFDLNVPEETNRRIVDHTADFNLVYTEHARRHLLSEGMAHRRIYLTGSPMREVLNHYRGQIDGSNVLEQLGLHHQEYFIVSVHREENVDDPANLDRILQALEQLQAHFGKQIIVSTHPRTRSRLDACNRPLPESVQFMKPFGFFAYNALQMHAFCAISDSGTIAEESAILGFPAITVRNAMERPEALDTGSILLTGLNPEGVLNGVRAVTEQHRESVPVDDIPEDYKIANTSQRVVNLIIGTAHLSNHWNNVRVPQTWRQQS